ncbi:MAG: SDR family oxidoreductase [Sandaracinus sp.]|nr:SDR family oxidoreductase [Sandaracinus sp.]MCB9613534.1 SDR family oxidoreductase [Sandaracinus sp.]MCB9619702.1 SDR family oxidoreductase [Sandaracinus sp.]MCB9624047.1 SDR family oxidoreductase [Sandaracinus sp.]
MSKLPSKPTAVITGGASGLGRAFALQLAARGGRVMIADLNDARAAETADELVKAGGEAFVRRCDVGDAADVAALAEASVEALGRIDLLVNNAGVAVAGPVGEASLEDWEFALRVNLWGVIYGCHAFVPTFRAQRSGHVLNVASAAGIATLPEMGPYNVGKAGVIALSETLEAELAPFGVGVSVLCPTFFPTNLMESFRGSDPKQKAQAEAFFRRASATAEGVARFALRGVEKDEFLLLPQQDARFVWRSKRFAPGAYRAALRTMQRFGLADRFLK